MISTLKNRAGSAQPLKGRRNRRSASHFSRSRSYSGSSNPTCPIVGIVGRNATRCERGSRWKLATAPRSYRLQFGRFLEFMPSGHNTAETPEKPDRTAVPELFSRKTSCPLRQNARLAVCTRVQGHGRGLHPCRAYQGGRIENTGRLPSVPALLVASRESQVNTIRTPEKRNPRWVSNARRCWH